MDKLKQADHDIRVKRGLVEKEKSADLPVEPVARPDGGEQGNTVEAADLVDAPADDPGLAADDE